MNLIRRASADAVVGVIVEQVTPGRPQEADGIFRAERARGERAERLGPEAELILALSIALLEVNPAGVNAGDQPLLILAAWITAGLAQFADQFPIELAVHLP